MNMEREEIPEKLYEVLHPLGTVGDTIRVSSLNVYYAHASDAILEKYGINGFKYSPVGPFLLEILPNGEKIMTGIPLREVVEG